MTAPRLRPALIAATGLLALWLLLAAPAPAHAAPTTIAGWGHGAGRVNNPGGVAVDNSCARHVPPLSGAACEEFDPHDGDLYVADGNNSRIDRFGPAGEFQLAWGYGVADGKAEGLQVCGPGAPVPTKRCFAGLDGAAGEVAPTAVAVEAAAPHDIYVAEPSDVRVSKFTPTGQFVFMLGKDVNKTKVAEGGASQAERDICTAASGDACGGGKSGTGPGEFEAPRSLAFDGAGNLWVNDNGARAQRFDPGGGFLGEVPLPAGTQSAALAIDPASDDFYALGPQGHNEVQTIRLNSSFGEPADSSEFTLSFEGQATGPLPYIEWNATEEEEEELAEEIQPALEALPAVGEGNISVAYHFGQFSVTFIRDLGGRGVPQIAPTTLGEAPPVTVTTATQGNPGVVRRLDPTGAPLETLDDEEGDIPRALATDAVGNLYVGDGGFPYHLLRYNSAGELTSVFGAGQVLGGDIFGNGPTGNAIALDEAGASLYTASSAVANVGDVAAAKARVAVQRFDLPEPGPLPENERVKEGTLLPTTATLAADLNPEGHKTTYSFEYGTSTSYGESTPSRRWGPKASTPKRSRPTSKS